MRAGRPVRQAEYDTFDRETIMDYNVSSLLREHTGATREYDIDDDLTVDGGSHHVRGHARLDRTPSGILVRARIRGEAIDECSRCLRPVQYPVELAFEEEYMPTVDVATGARLTVPEGSEEAYRIDEHHILDLRGPAAEYWAVALPMAPLCRDDCPGLCPVCGEELAEGHPCTREQVDARWSKLANLHL